MAELSQGGDTPWTVAGKANLKRNAGDQPNPKTPSQNVVEPTKGASSSTSAGKSGNRGNATINPPAAQRANVATNAKSVKGNHQNSSNAAGGLRNGQNISGPTSSPSSVFDVNTPTDVLRDIKLKVAENAKIYSTIPKGSVVKVHISVCNSEPHTETTVKSELTNMTQMAAAGNADNGIIWGDRERPDLEIVISFDDSLKSGSVYKQICNQMTRKMVQYSKVKIKQRIFTDPDASEMQQRVDFILPDKHCSTLNISFTGLGTRKMQFVNVLSFIECYVATDKACRAMTASIGRQPISVCFTTRGGSPTNADVNTLMKLVGITPAWNARWERLSLNQIPGSKATDEKFAVVRIKGVCTVETVEQLNNPQVLAIRLTMPSGRCNARVAVALDSKKLTSSTAEVVKALIDGEGKVSQIMSANYTSLQEETVTHITEGADDGQSTSPLLDTANEQFPVTNDSFVTNHTSAEMISVSDYMNQPKPTNEGVAIASTGTSADTVSTDASAEVPKEAAVTVSTDHIPPEVAACKNGSISESPAKPSYADAINNGPAVGSTVHINTNSVSPPTKGMDLLSITTGISPPDLTGSGSSKTKKVVKPSKAEKSPPEDTSAKASSTTAPAVTTRAHVAQVSTRQGQNL